MLLVDLVDPTGKPLFLTLQPGASGSSFRGENIDDFPAVRQGHMESIISLDAMQ